MVIKEIRDEDFTSYKKPSMVIGFPSCTFKCERECGQKVCQNSVLATAPDIQINVEDIVERYLKNPITKAIIMAGLEPFDSWDNLSKLIIAFRLKTTDDIVIYTGYTEEELKDRFCFQQIIQYPNIVIKFGRFRPNETPHYDETLGIKLASDNQYAKRYNYESIKKPS